LSDLPEVSGLSFEEALLELEKTVKQLEEGKGKLDDAISAYGRGVALKRLCETKLSEAQRRVDSIALNPDGSITIEKTDFVTK
jgi:exodeoxyribonuclease VII small subunit